jgi:membrane protein DedA with SNARE-associated domain
MFNGARTYLLGTVVACMTLSLWSFAMAPLGGPSPMTANGLLAWLELTLAVTIALVAIVSTVHRAASHVLGHRGFRSSDVPPEVTCPSPQRGHDRQCEE